MNDEGEATPPRGRRGIYLLPNLFTTGALFAGFYGIIAAFEGQFTAAAVAIFVAMILDGVDGRVARMTQTQTAFGAEYDSLADMVSFGVAPAIIIYLWALSGLGQLGWVVAFFYAAATALRLARFNVKAGSSDKRFFQGLPSPSAAAVLMGMVWVWNELGFAGQDLFLLALLLTVLSGAAMVSNLTYFSFKDMDFRHRVPFFVVLGVLFAVMLTALDPAKVLWTGFLLYALSGPGLALLRWRRKRMLRAGGD
ncbi:CDP-diacylglycerol--serine O-phosphatidyltransferase [Ectothiorhodospira haloalkaliphila]|uniref:CDP-diacylglycerol--serine O-phosphatidyltransferase n=1 Tax=Ectothiorhodospira haloalkaliphila TaxID=421628 RepID=W8KH85_9GAMM|nr:CDP-diacylglycerol--serine O-phosphatidyltransferase [Ectothiorhodospira haloalkaliphila]MCG5493235.1 CDP-diacylglycerol--serine O-phosphatidyltransferase [Ectothiorhodospira variabilis]AHK78533.1 CDP-diacylglycerol--serine O-phosphatidyltransferase [Ectothiorhodospira haloalkaliphila]MCG5499089.1 CDP-diacylglycerol--serine O-phosphatidyltransferase [Ectothiorhodospira variabilis]MCG5502564.1 CDP-diacylglycerol--serine O-phosphatidyltransferase [Ectothiorhodospira variabilis]MCG5505670.1 CD